MLDHTLGHRAGELLDVAGDECVPMWNHRGFWQIQFKFRRKFGLKCPLGLAKN